MLILTSPASHGDPTVPTPIAPTPVPETTPAPTGLLPALDLSNVDFAALVWHVALAIAIILIGRWLARLVRRWTHRGLQKVTVTETVAQLAERAAYYLTLMLAVFLALVVIGVPTTGLVYTIAIVLIIFGVALQESLSSFAATVIFLLFQPFKVGELIETNGVMGTVREISLFHTVLTKADNKLLNLPNAQIQNNVLVNYSRLGTLRADMTFGIGYTDDLRKAKQVLEAILAADPRVLPDPPPVVVVQELDDNAVVLAIRPWVKYADYWTFRTDVTERVKLQFDAEGISFPFPQRDVHVHYVPDVKTSPETP
jgi:small conductance mechanosensitive channel